FHRGWGIAGVPGRQGAAGCGGAERAFGGSPLMLKTPIVAGNWTMHMGPSEVEPFFAAFLAAYPESGDRSIAFFPPAVSLAAARTALAGRGDVSFGVQNIYWEPKGAFTGETSAAM